MFFFSLSVVFEDQTIQASIQIDKWKDFANEFENQNAEYIAYLYMHILLPLNNCKCMYMKLLNEEVFLIWLKTFTLFESDNCFFFCLKTLWNHFVKHYNLIIFVQILQYKHWKSLQTWILTEWNVKIVKECQWSVLRSIGYYNPHLKGDFEKVGLKLFLEKKN